VAEREGLEGDRKRKLRHGCRGMDAPVSGNINCDAMYNCQTAYVTERSFAKRVNRYDHHNMANMV